MHRRRPVAIVATMSLALFVLASGAAWAPPKWRGAQFQRLAARGQAKSLMGEARPSFAAGVRSKIRMELDLDRDTIPTTLPGAKPSDVFDAVGRACKPGEKIVMQSDAFIPREATAVIQPDGTARSFVLSVILRPVPRGQDPRPAWVSLVSCGDQKFTFDPQVGGVGAEFEVESRLVLTGRNQRTSAFVGLALMLAGGLLLFVTRTRRRERPAS